MFCPWILKSTISWLLQGKSCSTYFAAYYRCVCESSQKDKLTYQKNAVCDSLNNPMLGKVYFLSWYSTPPSFLHLLGRRKTLGRLSANSRPELLGSRGPNEDPGKTPYTWYKPRTSKMAEKSVDGKGYFLQTLCTDSSLPFKRKTHNQKRCLIDCKNGLTLEMFHVGFEKRDSFST